MRLALMAALLLLMTPAAAEARVCDWCVFGNPKITADLIALSKLKPKVLLGEIRSRGICVKVMQTGRRVSKGKFKWSTIERATLPLRGLTNLAGLPGRFLCKNELPVAESCPTIVLAADAPFGTLLREYVREQQAERDTAWCAMAKKLWSRSPTSVDLKGLRDKEWDAALFFWNNKTKMRLSLEDRIVLTNAVINEAQLRRNYDPDGEKFLKADQPEEYLKTLNEEFEK